MGPKYVIQQEPKLYINELITDTENAIRALEPKIQNTYRHLATKRISMTNRKNLLHKRHQYNLNNIKKILQSNDAIVLKADKSKAIVIINTDTLNKKADTFIQDNNINK